MPVRAFGFLLKLNMNEGGTVREGVTVIFPAKIILILISSLANFYHICSRVLINTFPREVILVFIAKPN